MVGRIVSISLATAAVPAGRIARLKRRLAVPCVVLVLAALCLSGCAALRGNTTQQPERVSEWMQHPRVSP